MAKQLGNPVFQPHRVFYTFPSGIPPLMDPRRGVSDMPRRNSTILDKHVELIDACVYGCMHTMFVYMYDTFTFHLLITISCRQSFVFYTKILFSKIM